MDVELILSARFENRDGAENLHLGPIDKRLSRRHHGVAPNHARDLGALIFEREILMAARMQFVIGNFALDPNRAEFHLERVTN